MTEARTPVADRIGLEVERAIKRRIKGVEYIASPTPSVGVTPKDVIYKKGTLNLYHYHPIASEIYRVPILIVMATSNRGYILDLAPGQSFVEFLLRCGYDVYMLDWSAPGGDERGLTLEDYTQKFIPECVRRVQERSGESEITMLGYCMGGVLSLIYTLTTPGAPLKNLVCFTTPIDFSKMELFSKWSDKRFFDVDQLVDTVGNVPSEMLFASFEALRPASRLAAQTRLWEGMWNDEFVTSYRMVEKWANDTLPLAGEYFRATIKDIIWKNGLATGDMSVGGRKVDLKHITVPMLHVLAEHDHIVPEAAAKPLIAAVSSTDKTEVVIKGGHVSIVAGANAQRRLWPKLDAWLGERST